MVSIFSSLFVPVLTLTLSGNLEQEREFFSLPGVQLLLAEETAFYIFLSENSQPVFFRYVRIYYPL